LRDGIDLAPEGLFRQMQQGSAVGTSPPERETFARLWRQLPAGPALTMWAGRVVLDRRVNEGQALNVVLASLRQTFGDTPLWVSVASAGQWPAGRPGAPAADRLRDRGVHPTRAPMGCRPRRPE
jgi:hypothetical protein